MSQRVTYRRHNNYKTRSNRMRLVKTPGGKLSVHIRTKSSRGPHCGDCKQALQGIPCLRPYAYKHLARTKRTVARAYGGSRCMRCVRERILRAVLIEEQKIVKKLVRGRKAVPEVAPAPVAAKPSSRPQTADAKKKAAAPAKKATK